MLAQFALDQRKDAKRLTVITPDGMLRTFDAPPERGDVTLILNFTVDYLWDWMKAEQAVWERDHKGALTFV